MCDLAYELDTNKGTCSPLPKCVEGAANVATCSDTDPSYAVACKPGFTLTNPKGGRCVKAAAAGCTVGVNGALACKNGRATRCDTANQWLLAQSTGTCVRCGTDSLQLTPYCLSCDVRNVKKCAVCADDNTDAAKRLALYVDSKTGTCKQVGRRRGWRHAVGRS